MWIEDTVLLTVILDRYGMHSLSYPSLFPIDATMVDRPLQRAEQQPPGDVDPTKGVLRRNTRALGRTTIHRQSFHFDTIHSCASAAPRRVACVLGAILDELTRAEAAKRAYRAYTCNRLRTLGAGRDVRICL